MKKISKILAIISVFVLALSLNTYAKQKIYLFVDGNHIKADAEPFIENGRTLVPIRFISENLKNKVDWNSDEKKVTVTPEEEREISKIELAIGSDIAKLYDKDGNVKEEKLEVPAKITNSRTFVPVRFISETLGTEVNWDPENRVVIIGDKTKYNSEKFKNEVIAKEPKEKSEPVKKQETKPVAKGNTKPKEFNYGGEKYVPTYTQNTLEVYKKLDKMLGVKRDKDGWGRAKLINLWSNKPEEFWFMPFSNEWTKGKTPEECFKLLYDRGITNQERIEWPKEVQEVAVPDIKDTYTRFKNSKLNSVIPDNEIQKLIEEFGDKKTFSLNKKTTLNEFGDFSFDVIAYLYLNKYRGGILEDMWPIPEANRDFQLTTFNLERDTILKTFTGSNYTTSLTKSEYNSNFEENIDINKALKELKLSDILNKNSGNLKVDRIFALENDNTFKTYDIIGVPNLPTRNSKVFDLGKRYPILGPIVKYNNILNEYGISSIAIDNLKYPGSLVCAKSIVVDTGNFITYTSTDIGGFSKPYKKLIDNEKLGNIGGKRVKKLITYVIYNGETCGFIHDVDFYIPTMQEVFDY